jgi:nucleotide-binding universal stress UspA family protein
VASDGHQIHIIRGDPRTTIGPLADSLKADVIVMGRHRESTALPAGRPVGGTAYAVITNTVAPCLVTTRTLALPLRRVLVAIDRSETARGALVVAISWASALRERAVATSDLLAIRVEANRPLGTSSHRTIDDDVEALRRDGGGWAGVTVKGLTLADGDPVTAITGAATQHDAQLVVLGTRGMRNPEPGALGSVAAAVTQRLTMPVLLVPPSIWRDYGRDINE